MEALRLVHHHPGRIRLRSEVFRDDDQVIYLVKQALAQIPAVTRVGHNTYTGSVLVEYSPGLIEPDTLLQAIAMAAGAPGVVDAALIRQRSADVAMDVIRAARKINDVTREVAGADLGVIAPAALFVGAIVSFVRRPVPLRWDNLLYWSWTVFTNLNHQKIHGETPPGEDEDEDPR